MRELVTPQIGRLVPGLQIYVGNPDKKIGWKIWVATALPS